MIRFSACCFLLLLACSPGKKFPAKDNFWIFILAGQSNMAGRGVIEPDDTIPSLRIYQLRQDSTWALAQEPLHYYEPSRTGLDCGLSFARALSQSLPEDIYIGLVPCAVGGSSVEQWLGDSTHRDVKLFSNFSEKVQLAQEKGIIKGILWHQGEANANENGFKDYQSNLRQLFARFRTVVKNDSLPIVGGELGSFLDPRAYGHYPDSVNAVLRRLKDSDDRFTCIETGDLTHKGDSIHFDSRSLREMGKRYAEQVSLFYKSN